MEICHSWCHWWLFTCDTILALFHEQYGTNGVLLTQYRLLACRKESELTVGEKMLMCGSTWYNNTGTLTQWSLEARFTMCALKGCGVMCAEELLIIIAKFLACLKGREFWILTMMLICIACMKCLPAVWTSLCVNLFAAGIITPSPLSEIWRLYNSIIPWLDNKRKKEAPMKIMALQYLLLLIVSRFSVSTIFHEVPRWANHTWQRDGSDMYREVCTIVGHHLTSSCNLCRYE